MQLREIMSQNVKTIALHATAEEAWELMQRLSIRHLVVLQGKELVGVISERDLGGRRGASWRQDKLVADLASDSFISASADMTPKQAANLMRGHNIGCLPIVEDEKLVGILTITDMLELIGRGAAKPVLRHKRWTLRHRGQRGGRERTIPNK